MAEQTSFFNGYGAFGVVVDIEVITESRRDGSSDHQNCGSCRHLVRDVASQRFGRCQIEGNEGQWRPLEAKGCEQWEGA